MSTTTRRLEGAPVAAALEGASRALLRGRTSGSPPTLVSVHRDVPSPFRFYRRQQARAAEVLGIRFRDLPLPATEGAAGLVDRMTRLDADPEVHAVLLEHPLPPPLDFEAAVATLRAEKDVDGVGPANRARLVGGRPGHAPAVALAALAIARHYRLPIDGEAVAVVGRSATVGLPLALLLAARSPGPNATVTIAHTGTKDLRGALAGARTIFSCAGRPGLLSRAVVPEGAAVVDVGLSSVPDPSRPGGARAVGDADAASLDGWAEALTPVPGGVGPVTVAELMRSCVGAWSALQPGGGGT